jgi:hypothetical protein
LALIQAEQRRVATDVLMVAAERFAGLSKQLH